jgi:hypothetical protein
MRETPGETPFQNAERPRLKISKFQVLLWLVLGIAVVRRFFWNI